MAKDSDKAWFAPKLYGYGAGLPISWEGWLVLAVYLLIVCGAAFALPLITPIAESVAAIAVITIVATIVLLIICVRKTRGGWRWRWGGQD
jgi:uncharacterized membrane protein YphA (DoxX/SURF4 family)